MPIADIISLGQDVIGLFQGKEPTPEEQRKKAGVWNNMLKDWTSEDRAVSDTYPFASKWESRLPFSQKGTKRDFMNNEIKGKDSETVINTLVEKVNDELTKGGFSPLSRSSILAGMSTGGSVFSSMSNSANTASPLIGQISKDVSAPIDKGESNKYFIVTVLLGIAAFILIWTNIKK